MRIWPPAAASPSVIFSAWPRRPSGNEADGRSALNAAVVAVSVAYSSPITLGFGSTLTLPALTKPPTVSSATIVFWKSPAFEIDGARSSTP